MANMKLKKGDMVKIIAGKDVGREGKILFVDRKKRRVIVENANMIVKHQKPGRGDQSGGIVKKEAPLDASNVMYMHNGKPTRVGFRLTTTVKDGKNVTVKQRIAKSTNEVID